MKNLIFLFGLLLIPSVSLAAPLTQNQATSLIAVVQSSPTTPASAFTNLITAFSNITTNQAESLINVVQQAVGVPADAFVGMLLAFTVDIVQPPTEPEPMLGGTPPVDNPPAPPAPVVESTTVKDIVIIKRYSAYPDHVTEYPLGMYWTLEVHVMENEQYLKQRVQTQVAAPSGKITAFDKGKTNEHGYATYQYIPYEKGVPITITANGMTKEITI